MSGGKTPSASKSGERISERQFELAEPTLESAAGQVEEIVRTGGSTALIPSIQRAVEAASGAVSSSRTAASQNLTRAGITGTDFASIMANLQQQGDLAVSGIPGQFTLPIQMQALQAVLGLPSLSIQGLTGAAGAQAQAQSGVSAGTGAAIGGGAAAVGTITAILI